MVATLYPTPDNFIAGITMKDPAMPEAGNMALHVCENAENVVENRKKLAASLGCSLEDFVSAYQRHTDNFHKVTWEDRGRGAKTMDDVISDTDALYTFEPGLLLCCFTSDCVPLIMYDETTGLVGTIHSGWEGSVKEITPKTLQHLIGTEKIDPQNLKIIIGPAISQEKFEVDRDVCDRFKALGYADEFIIFNEKTGKYHIDNQLTVKRQCELQGIPAANISIDRTCTYSGADCFSHRRDKVCGRHLTFVIRKK